MRNLHWILAGFDSKGEVVLHLENIQTVLDDLTLGEALNMVIKDIAYPLDMVRLKVDIAL